jgi:hypothetical protein
MAWMLLWKGLSRRALITGEPRDITDPPGGRVPEGVFLRPSMLRLALVSLNFAQS